MQQLTSFLSIQFMNTLQGGSLFSNVHTDGCTYAHYVLYASLIENDHTIQAFLQ